MNTAYNAQINNADGEYTIQFQTGNYEFFKMVERACRKAIDKKDRAVLKERCSQMRTMGHL